MVGNPRGPAFLVRDVARVTEWFAARGLPSAAAGAATLLDDLCADLGIPPGAATGTTSHP